MNNKNKILIGALLLLLTLGVLTAYKDGKKDREGTTESVEKSDNQKFGIDPAAIQEGS